MGSILSGPLEEELEWHNREMQRVRNYIRSKRKKSKFELCAIGSYKMLYNQALKVVQDIRELWPESRRQSAVGNGMCDSGKRLKLGLHQDDQGVPEAVEVQPSGQRDRKPLYLCHGDLDQHHVLMGGSYTATIEYNWMHLGIQIPDLYCFTHKVMEKHGWNPDLGLSMLDSYERVLPMEPKERECLYYLFLCPEKYWKQLNFYYGANKAWIPARNTDELRGLEEQQQARNSFSKRLKADCDDCVRRETIEGYTSPFWFDIA